MGSLLYFVANGVDQVAEEIKADANNPKWDFGDCSMSIRLAEVKCNLQTIAEELESMATELREQQQSYEQLVEERKSYVEFMQKENQPDTNT